MPDQLTESAPVNEQTAAPETAPQSNGTPAPFDWSHVPDDAWDRIPTDRLGELRHKNPTVKQWWQSEVGREAATKADARIAQEQERMRAEREARMLDEDPDQFIAQEKQKRMETVQQATARAESQQAVLEYFRTLPEPLQAKLGGKLYPGSFAEGLKAFIADVVETAAEHRLGDMTAKEREKWEKNERARLHKEVLAEVNGGEPSPDLDSGSAAAGKRTYTTKEIDAMSLVEYRKHKDDIDKAAREGRIKSA